MARLKLLAQVVAAFTMIIVQTHGVSAAPASAVTSVNPMPGLEVPGQVMSGPMTADTPLIKAEGSCRNHPGGGKCPEHAPCCLNGYCSDDPRYCSVGCEAKNSWKETSCFPKAYCIDIHEDFNQPKLASIRTFNGNPNDYDFMTDYNSESVSVQDSKLRISMKLDTILNSYGRPQGLGSVVSTTRFMQYGKVTARIKTGSSSPGVVSAFIIRNEDPGDEIDFEFVGRDPSEAQTNFYYSTPPDLPPSLIDYGNTGKERLGNNTALGFHDYEIEWMPDHIMWKVDGTVIRTVLRNQTKDDVDPATGAPIIDKVTGQIKKKYPSTPARIQFGIWDGGQGSEGTASWAGTPTNWSRADQSYEVQVDYINVQCFYQGNATTTWPPAGYGPTKSHNGPYYTPGHDNRDIDAPGGGSIFNEQPMPQRPFVPFYKNPKLMIPTGCLLGIALLVVGTIEITKRRRVAQVRWK